MKILVTGATGFIGSRLIERLLLAGHEIVIVTRNKKKAEKSLLLPVKIIEHDLTDGAINDPYLDGVEGVVHLMGESIANRWTEKEKQKILNSRVNSTKNLVETINESIPTCNFVVSASAIHIYPESKNNEEWTEDANVQGDSFLTKVVNQWEQSWEGLPAHVRKVILRFSVVLGSEGGMMQKILPIYRAGIGGKLGSGEQWMSWIHLIDLCRLIEFSIVNNLNGTYNATSSNPAKNKLFNQLLGKYTQRPAIATVPEFALKIVMGEASLMALDSIKVSNKKVIDAGFEFKYPDIEMALKDVCCFEELPPKQKKAFHHFYRRVQYVDKPLEETFEFFSEGKNLEKITPDFLNFRTLSQSDDRIQEGTKIKYKLSLYGIPFKWTTYIRNWQPQVGFIDYQESGPYEVWYHQHLFYSLGEGTLVVDEVKYRLPSGALGEMVAGMKVHSDVDRIFNYRIGAIKGQLG